MCLWVWGGRLVLQRKKPEGPVAPPGPKGRAQETQCARSRRATANAKAQQARTHLHTPTHYHTNQPPHAPPHAPTPKRTDTLTPDPRTHAPARGPDPTPNTHTHTQIRYTTPPPARQRQPHAAAWPAPAPHGSRRGPPGPPPQCPDQANPERRNNTHAGAPIRRPTRNGARPRRPVSEGWGTWQRRHTLPISAPKPRICGCVWSCVWV